MTIKCFPYFLILGLLEVFVSHYPLICLENGFLRLDTSNFVERNILVNIYQTPTTLIFIGPTLKSQSQITLFVSFLLPLFLSHLQNFVCTYIFIDALSNIIAIFF